MIDEPVQPLAEGVMVKVTVIGTFAVLVSVPLIFPEPLAAIPVTTPLLFLVHANVVDGVALLNTIIVIGEPEQTVCDAGVAVAAGIGFTVTVAVIGVPLQVTPAFV